MFHFFQFFALFHLSGGRGDGWQGMAMASTDVLGHARTVMTRVRLYVCMRVGRSSALVPYSPLTHTPYFLIFFYFCTVSFDWGGGGRWMTRDTCDTQNHPRAFRTPNHALALCVNSSPTVLWPTRPTRTSLNNSGPVYVVCVLRVRCMGCMNVYVCVWELYVLPVIPKTTHEPLGRQTMPLPSV